MNHEEHSDVIDEDAEHNGEHANSFENIRRYKKGPGSLDDCDEEPENVDRQEFIKGIIGDKNLVGDS
jgi:hypothetical protein